MEKSNLPNTDPTENSQPAILLGLTDSKYSSRIQRQPLNIIYNFQKPKYKIIPIRGEIDLNSLFFYILLLNYL